MTDGEPWTINRLLTWTASYFSDNGSETPRLDAEVLLSHALGCQRIDLYARFDQTPNAEQLAEFRAWVKRRAGGEPVAYLVGEKEFYSLSFSVNHHVLIPRPETEGLVMETIDRIPAGNGQPIRIADVGTGSGIIAVTLAKHVTHAQIVALEISEAALDVARTNAERHGVADRIDFRISDLMAEATGDAFDIIVSNPPYIGLQERDELPLSVREFEPETALFAGPNGTDTIARLIDQAATRLREGGYLLMEISPNIRAAVVELVAQCGSFDPAEVKKDMAGLDRIIIARCKSSG